MEQIKISKLSFGAATLGGVYGDINKSQALDAVREALNLGINLFDTSPYYGNSEEVLGHCLLELKEEFPRNTYIISTKVGRYGLEEFDYSREKIRKSVLNSLRLLNTTYLDIVYCHDVEFVEENMVLDHALKELFLLKNEGLIKNVGVSGYPLEVLESITKKSFNSGNPLDCILSYCHYTLQNDLLTQSGFISKLKELYKVKYIFNASPLSMGLLSGHEPPEWHPAPPSLKSAAKECTILCQERNFNLADLALIYSLQCPSLNLTSTLVGCKNIDEVKKNHCILTKISKGEFDNEQVKKLINDCINIFQENHNFSWPSPPLDYKLH